MSSVKTGTVIWFQNEKGFGFIKQDEEGPDLFVHYTAIQASGYRSLKPEQRVSYITEEGKNGPQAANVQKI